MTAEIQSIWIEPAYNRDLTAIEELRNGRGVKAFHEMPPMHQAAYLCIASHYPGVQVYACGSRVRGDYVDLWSKHHVREARAAAGMRDKKESDFDFVLAQNATPIDFLPKWADRVTCQVPASEMVKIPIYNYPETLKK
jgi:hypothetical protein